MCQPLDIQGRSQFVSCRGRGRPRRACSPPVLTQQAETRQNPRRQISVYRLARYRGGRDYAAEGSFELAHAAVNDVSDELKGSGTRDGAELVSATTDDRQTCRAVRQLDVSHQPGLEPLA